MASLAQSHKKQAANGLTILTLTMIGFGLIFFYLASQAVTPEDAHLVHWGSAAVGGVAGWAIGILVERFRK
jgi:phosphatidylglycerophosphate synthase